MCDQREHEVSKDLSVSTPLLGHLADLIIIIAEKSAVLSKPDVSLVQDFQQLSDAECSSCLNSSPALTVTGRLAQHNVQNDAQPQAGPVSREIEELRTAAASPQQQVHNECQVPRINTRPSFNMDQSGMNNTAQQNAHDDKASPRHFPEDVALGKFALEFEEIKLKGQQSATNYVESIKEIRAALKEEKELLVKREQVVARREISIDDREKAIEPKAASIKAREEDLKQNHDQFKHRITLAIAREDALEQRENRVKQREQRLLEEEERLQQLSEELEEKEAERSQLLVAMEELPARIESLTAGSAISLKAAPRELDLKGLHFDTVFEAIPNGSINAGIFKQKIGQEIALNGKQFDQFQYLSAVPKLAVDGKADQKAFRYQTRPYTHYTKNGTEKMVQKLTPECLVQHQGTFYIRQLVLKEKETDKDRSFTI